MMSLFDWCHTGYSSQSLATEMNQRQHCLDKVAHPIDIERAFIREYAYVSSLVGDHPRGTNDRGVKQVE